MQGLNLYSKIEKYLDIDEQANALHTTFQDIVAQLNPSSLLDIGCGQGAFLETLKDSPIKTLGIDLSSSQIEICNQKNITAKCINIDKVDQKFDCATAIFDVINYISKEDIPKFLENINKVLNKDGYLIFDINTLYGFEDVTQGVLNIDLEDKFIAIDATYDEDILETNITLFSQDKDCYKKENETIKQYFHSKEFLIKELKNYGFEVEAVQNFKLHDVEESDKQLFIVKKVL